MVVSCGSEAQLLLYEFVIACYSLQARAQASRHVFPVSDSLTPIKTSAKQELPALCATVLSTTAHAHARATDVSQDLPTCQTFLSDR